jgi:hypothetical protein
MKFRINSVVIFVIGLFGSLSAAVSMDPLWIYKDLPPTAMLYGSILVRDTSRGFEFNTIYPVDTGDAIDQSYYNFVYQFKSDTFKIYDEFEPTTVVYRDYRPGYAGFKIDWDNGITGFSVGRYKYLVMAHKGPLPNHKVTIRFGYNSGCGTPTVFQTIGSFSASANWKIDSVQIPDSIRNVSKETIQERNYYEMQVLINNVDPNGSPSSEIGVFKFDNIALVDTTSKISVIVPLHQNKTKSIRIASIDRNVLSVDFTAKRSLPATFVVYTSDGRCLGPVYSTILQPGSNKFNLNSIVKARGVQMAIIRVDAGGCSATQQIMLGH